MNKKIDGKSYCPICDAETTFSISKEKETRMVLGVSVECEIIYATCDECGELMDVSPVAKANAKNIADAYRKKTGLLTSDEIISIRTKYGLSASSFAKLIGAGEKTITRYENGRIQDEVFDKLMRLLKRESVFELLLDDCRSRNLIRQYENIGKAKEERKPNN